MNYSDEKPIPEWQETQWKIAQFLKKSSFDVWEERMIKNKRVDILAKRAYRNKIYYIIIEFKHYEKVTSSIEDKFLEQLKDYLIILIQRELDRKGFSQISRNYIFIGYLLLSKDYGIYKNRRKNWRKTFSIPDNKDLEYIWNRNLYLFSSTEDYLRSNLESIGLSFYSQTSLQDFTEKEL